MILDFEDELTISCLSSYANLNDLKIGVTSGCWDLTHDFHLKYWQRCKRFCDLLVVGVDDDFLIKSSKGDKRPIFSEDQRLSLVNHSKYVSAAFIMHNIIDLEHMILMLNAKYLFKNQLFKNASFEVVGAKHAELIIIDDVNKCTSTGEYIDIIERNNDERKNISAG